MEALRVKSKHMTQTSRARRGAHGTRLLLGILLLGMAASGCEEASSNGQTGEIVDAWKQSGLMPTVFSALEDESLKPGKCQQGKVDGVTVVLCEYADAAASHAAHATGLGHVGETTGLALAGSKYLLIVSDPDKADPSGRKINAIAEAFREVVAPRKPAGAAAGAGKAATEGKAAQPEGKKQ